MVERTDRPCFFREFPKTIGIGRKMREQDLDGHIATQTLVARSPHFARPSGTKPAHNGVRSDQLTGTQRPPFRRHRLRKPLEGGFIMNSPEDASASSSDRTSARSVSSVPHHRSINSGRSSDGSCRASSKIR